MIVDMDVVVWESSFLLALLVLLSLLAYSVVRFIYSGKKSAFFFSNKKVLIEIRLIVAKLYWMYIRLMNDYYQTVVPWHTGVVNDYVSLFLATMAIIMTLLFFVAWL